MGNFKSHRCHTVPDLSDLTRFMSLQHWIDLLLGFSIDFYRSFLFSLLFNSVFGCFCVVNSIYKMTLPQLLLNLWQVLTNVWSSFILLNILINGLSL